MRPVYGNVRRKVVTRSCAEVKHPTEMLGAFFGLEKTCPSINAILYRRAGADQRSSVRKPPCE